MTEKSRYDFGEFPISILDYEDFEDAQKCPHCGEKAKLLYDRYRFWVECGNHNCQLSGPSCETEKEAIQKWNKIKYMGEE